MIVFSLLLAGGAENEMPPRGPVSLSISDLSRRFGVSRAHVRKLLRDAADEGYLERAGSQEGHFLLRPRLIEATENFVATLFLFLAHCARAAMDEIGAERAAG
jgi:DNA-binding IclR family transcriptional regulator